MAGNRQASRHNGGLKALIISRGAGNRVTQSADSASHTSMTATGSPAIIRNRDNASRMTQWRSI